MTILNRRFIEDVTVGEILPTLEWTATLDTLVVYAAATWDFHRSHYDTEFMKSLGMPAPQLDGQMVGALFTRQLMHWGGPDAFIRRLSYRQRRPVYAADRIVLHGRVSETVVESGKHLALCTLGVRMVDDTEVVTDATAAVELGTRGSGASSDRMSR